MITSKLRPGRINGFEQYVYQKQATKEYNLSICDYIPQAKECLKTYGIFGAEEYWKLQTMNIPINDKLLGYCSCCILGEAGALKELIKYSSSLYQTDSELRKKVKRLLRKLALAKYPLEGADRYSDEYYMILADYHLGVFGKQKYMSYDRAIFGLV